MLFVLYPHPSPASNLPPTFYSTRPRVRVCYAIMAHKPIPYASPAEPVDRERHVATIEQTAKRWKMHIALSSILSVLAVFVLLAGVQMGNDFVAASGGILLALGLAWYTFGRVGAWWDHG